MEMEEKRMKWEEERYNREEQKDERFLNFMKDMFTMMILHHQYHQCLMIIIYPMLVHQQCME